MLAVMDERGNAVLKGVDGMDKAKILRLLDEADDIVSALYRQGANKDYKCKSLREKLKAIAAEITAPPKTNGDRIRQMTDEELIELVNSSVCHYTDCLDNDCEECGRKWIMKEVSEDAGSKTD